MKINVLGLNGLIKFSFFFNFIFLRLSFSYVIIPLKYMPVYKINDTTPSSIMRNIIYTKAYASLDLGSPKQSIQIPLDFDSNDFYISEHGKYEFSREPSKFADLKFYNSSSSNSCEKVEEKIYDGDNFDYSSYYKDIFYFGEKEVELEFYLPIILKHPESGGIGLQLWPKLEETTSTVDDKRTFLRKLKNNKLIDEYYWSIFYDSKDYNKKEGFILIGSLPHNLDIDLGYYKKEYFNSTYMKNINAEIWVDLLKYRFKVDDIYAFEGNNKEKKINVIIFPENATNLKTIELDYHFSGIQISNRFQNYFEKYFEEYITNEECFFGNFTLTRKKYFFYCKNDKNLISKIKKNFPGFNFKSHQLDFNFELVADDLFVEEKNFVYCIMFFDSSPGDMWIMGRPFLQKYQFIFNPDNKYINFYSNLDTINNDNTESNDSNTNSIYIILFAVISVSLIIILILGYLAYKFYFQLKFLKKKRANELDDDYDYAQKIEPNHKEALGTINE